ncbi:DUF2231 domain-containing protein [Leptolyngbya sp. FACHB-541]|uniref:DUF2231 domain-containing protein n=1 Tax=Leptolyngbya sp. FACHB-541 TaxID=2692810 RepID=UPI001685DE96|nr:DUF2231 domain-containing protein [Leptolyngbya sp. FACHB-541]MBD1869807.1 DUF2231 domain-containing protein [Cyanobacteria bacterium FACHB-471]MBD2001594.1 DUF2231 domain-containing protein [Leptolyngbya sp. FACHB-541]
MTQTPNIPPIIESDEREYRDSGVPSTVAIAGHPIHPVIVTLPIAFLVGAFATDAVYWLVGDDFWARASFWLIAAGLVTGIAAAITGMLDFLRIGRVRKHSAGWAHMVANVAVLVLTIINLVLRLNNVTGAVLPAGLILSLIVAALLGISGWYGGELVYRHKIAVIGYGDPEGP